MLSLEFGGGKKEPPEARKQEFVLSLEFWPVKRALWGSPGGRKEHFYHVFKQVLQKAPTGETAQKVSYSGNSAMERFRRNNVWFRVAAGGTTGGEDSHSLGTPSFDGVGGYSYNNHRVDIRHRGTKRYIGQICSVMLRDVLNQI